MELLRDSLHTPLSAVTTASTSSWQRPVLPEASQAPPDVMLHVGGCVFALHEEVLRLRWPWLHLQLQNFREQKDRTCTAISSRFKLQLASSDPSKGRKGAIERCPLQTITLLKPLLYTRCLASSHRRTNIEDEDSSSTDGDQEIQDIEVKETGKKRRRDESKQKRNNWNNWNNWNNRLLDNKRARRLFTKDMDITEMSSVKEVLHVELVGASAVAMISIIEYVYTFKFRLLHNTSARETLSLSQWVGMGDRIRYCCLKVAARQVTLDTWMELLVSTAKLSKKAMRRNLSERLIDFLYELQPVQFQDAMDKIQTMWIQSIDDHDMVVRVLVALINRVRFIEFWRNLLDALVKWLKRRFKTHELPSLRAIHHYFVKKWEPYVELSRAECFTNTPSANAAPLHVTLFEFGDFVLQACINATGSSPLLWRIIRRTSPNFFSEDPEVVLGSEVLDGDPEFWIRGQLIVKHQSTDQDGVIATEETRIEYQHCRHQYCRWNPLVSSKTSTLIRSSPSDEGWVLYEDPEHNYYRRTVCTVSGKLFLWGDPICSLYHQLLQTTLFNCALGTIDSDVGDRLTVFEMQQLPIETLELVLCSDRLRVPHGERTLLRCLNKMVFGVDVYHLAQLPQSYSGRVEDVTRLYRCVRWCFVPLDNIIQTLRWAPRTLKLYELIVENLRDPNRSHKRRRPFGWRKYRDAYMTNETNLSEFEIEAGDLHLAPSGAAELAMYSSVLR